MKPRTLSRVLAKAIKTFPAIVLTGPRQSGKTTLLKNQFGKTHRYMSLENPDVRLYAKNDPAGFIQRIGQPSILDEIQYVPELLPYIKTAIDERRKPGTWIITGSQNFILMQNVSESLAGRAAVLSLLPFSISESTGNGGRSRTVADILQNRADQKKKRIFHLTEAILRGSYPEIAANRNVDRALWCGSYITTYLERDIRNLKQVGDLGQYELFLRACAVRTGQILDLSSIAREIGVSFTTTKRWLSLLETGYQIFLLRPYFRNIGKRMVKRPKIYFTDTGLASYLLGIHTPENLLVSPFYGHLFETLIVTDFWKRFLHHGQMPAMYYLRTQDDFEVDLLLDIENSLNMIEIKSTVTIKPEHAVPLIKIKRSLGESVGKTIIISGAKDLMTFKDSIEYIPVSSLMA